MNKWSAVGICKREIRVIRNMYLQLLWSWIHYLPKSSVFVHPTVIRMVIYSDRVAGRGEMSLGDYRSGQFEAAIDLR